MQILKILSILTHANFTTFPFLFIPEK